MNKVDPSISRQKFTRDEDILILRLYLEIGSRWHDLAKRINELNKTGGDAGTGLYKRSEI